MLALLCCIINVIRLCPRRCHWIRCECFTVEHFSSTECKALGLSTSQSLQRRIGQSQTRSASHSLSCAPSMRWPVARVQVTLPRSRCCVNGTHAAQSQVRAKEPKSWGARVRKARCDHLNDNVCWQNEQRGRWRRSWNVQQKKVQLKLVQIDHKRRYWIHSGGDGCCFAARTNTCLLLCSTEPHCEL